MNLKNELRRAVEVTRCECPKCWSELDWDCKYCGGSGWCWVHDVNAWIYDLLNDRSIDGEQADEWLSSGLYWVEDIFGELQNFYIDSHGRVFFCTREVEELWLQERARKRGFWERLLRRLRGVA